MGFSLGSVTKSIGSLIGFKGESDAAEEAKDASKRQSAEIARAAADNREISLYDASVMEKDAVAAENAAAAKLSNHIKAADALLGKATARLGKSGVAVGSGSALDKQTEIISEAQREADIIIHDGQTARERRLSAAERYRLLADKGLRDAAAHASILEAAANAEAKQHQLSGYGWLVSGADSFYDTYKSGSESGGWLDTAMSSVGSWFGGGSSA